MTKDFFNLILKAVRHIMKKKQADSEENDKAKEKSGTICAFGFHMQLFSVLLLCRRDPSRYTNNRGCSRNNNTILYPFYNLCRHTADNSVRLDIFCYNCSGSDDSIISNSHTGKNSDIRTQPDFSPDMDWSREEVVALLRILIVVECGKNGIVPDQNTVIVRKMVLLVLREYDILKNTLF